MRMGVNMRLSPWIGGPMCVPVVLVVNMGMRVFQGLVLMLMLMPLGDMEPDTGRHQNRRRNERCRQRISKQ
jgi:hypothetical protein